MSNEYNMFTFPTISAIAHRFSALFEAMLLACKKRFSSAHCQTNKKRRSSSGGCGYFSVSHTDFQKKPNKVTNNDALEVRVCC